MNALRRRHAFVRFSWIHHEFLTGQYWSPMFAASVYPLVVNFSTSAPFQPFARYPQLRYTNRPDNLRLIAALSQQRDAFQEIGGRKMQQQSGLPAGHLHLRYVGKNTMVGVGGTFKAVRPEITGGRFSSGAVQAYAKLSIADIVLRV